MKEIKKTILPPQPEPTIYGKCRLVARMPISLPANATKEQFDQFGFYKYQEKEKFDSNIDIYPPQKDAVNSNAFFQQTQNSIDFFVLENGKSLPNTKTLKSTISELIALSKDPKNKVIATYQRENYIFLEKTTSKKLLFIDKGTSQIKSISHGANKYLHLSLPIFVLSSPLFYDYKKEQEYIYFLNSQAEFDKIRENNDGDNEYADFLKKLPDFIIEKILSGDCTINDLAYPHYNGGLKSNDVNAPQATFQLISYSNTANPFQPPTGAFSMGNIDKTSGNRYTVQYKFNNDNTVYRIEGKLKIYGYIPETSMERQAQSNVFISPLSLHWQGVVFRINENVSLKREVFEILGEEGKPSGCPPQ